MNQERTTSFAFARSQRRSSLQFGDFPTFDDIRKQEKFGIDRITGAKFWFYFRLYLPFIALVAFVLMFLIPYFLADNDDGFAFYGSLLSLVSCSLVVLSFFHVVPWRRHPSSLMLQISITSIIVSLIVIIKAFPSGRGWLSFNEGGLNLIDANGYSSEGDHTTPCQVMSFFIQLALLAREMWVFSLSLDLVTSITNPFASYRASVRKYHMIIWSMAIASATVLVNQPSCQGQFMADGTCWIRISGSQSPCFWGYFLSWVIAFYLFSVLAMLYAYLRISKGLESTYATRYACVADTFRVVFFYFGYCIVFYFFLSFIYIQPISDANIKFVESAYAYFIACRGFFDALVWFFSHGFSSSNNLGMTEVNHLTGINGNSYDGIVDTSTYAQCSRAQLRKQPTLTMADIVPPKPIVRSMYYTARAACRCMAHLIGCSCGSLASSKANSADHGADESDDEEEPLQNNNNTTRITTNNNATNPNQYDDEESHLRNTGDFKISDVTRSTRVSNSNLGSGMGSGMSAGLSRASGASVSGVGSSGASGINSSVRASIQEKYQSDIDLSPQLNFALRAELLYLVTMGIKESVLRLDQRDLHVLMTQPPVAYSPNNSRSNAIHSTQSYTNTNLSQSYSFSPSRSGYPNFTRASTLRRENTSGSVLSDTPNTTSNNYNSHGAGSPSNSVRYPARNTTNSYSMNNMSMAGSRIQYALRSIQCAVMGTHMPGEYGVDPITNTEDRGSVSINVSPLHYSARPSLAHNPLTHAHNAHNVHNQSRYSLYGAPPPLVKVPSLPNPHTAHPHNAHHSTTHTNTTHANSPTHTNHTTHEEKTNTDTHPTTNNTTTNPTNTTANSATTANPTTNSPVNSTQSEVDLSYTSSLQEQLLTENIDTHNLHYTTPPPVAPAEVIFNLNSKHQFRDFRPATFRKLRQMSGLDENRYLDLISQPTKERLSEGASGAFFFYCGEGELVVKTVAKHEASTLLKILDKYLTYLQSKPESLLVRFLGLHSISMYGNEFNFVVMKNIFPSNVRMNDKYDVKGSWVNRHATRKAPGKRATCKYCNEYFIEGSVDNCAEVVGGHEAIVTLKDSDMINKIRLYPDHAYSLIDILNSDSDALCSMGMMDYSLLVGVKTMQYDIDSLQQSQLAPVMPDQQRLSSFSDAAPYHFDTNTNNISSNNSNNANTTTRRSSLAPDVYTRTSKYQASANNNLNTNLPAPLAYDNIPFENRHSDGSDERPSDYTTQSDTHNNSNTYINANNANNANNDEFDPFIMSGYPARAVVAPSTYYLGVIDVLQTWSWSKRLEHLFKVYILQQPADGVSCVPPEEYKKRYQKKMAGIIEHSIFIREVTGSWRGKRHLSDPFPLMTTRGSDATNTTANTGANGSGNGLNARLSSAGSALAGILEESHLRTSSLNEAEHAHDLKEVRGSVDAVSSSSSAVGGGIGNGVGDSDTGSVGGDSGKSGKSGGASPKSEHSLVSSHPVALDP